MFSLVVELSGTCHYTSSLGPHSLSLVLTDGDFLRGEKGMVVEHMKGIGRCRFQVKLLQ